VNLGRFSNLKARAKASILKAQEKRVQRQEQTLKNKQAELQKLYAKKAKQTKELQRKQRVKDIDKVIKELKKETSTVRKTAASAKTKYKNLKKKLK